MATTRSDIKGLIELGRREHLTLGERVAAHLELEILRGEYAEGERLPTEAELGDAVGVSRSVIRDAVRILAARGLVDVRQGHGIVVSAATDQTFGNALIALLMRSDLTMGDVIDARAVLEIELAGIAARNATAANLDAMEDDLAAFTAAVDAGNWEVVQERHFRFHTGLFHALQMPALELVLRPVHQYIFFSSIPPRPEDPDLWDVSLHPPILEALRNHDESAAREAMERHFAIRTSDTYAELWRTPFRAVAPVEALRALPGSNHEAAA